MIVLDASVAVDLLLGRPDRVGFVRESLVDPHWVVPEHFMVEVASGLRGSWLGGDITDNEFDDVLNALAGLQLDVWPTPPLLPRIRELAHNATTYDAAYIALAEEVGASLVTSDAKLGAVPGIRCPVLSP